MPTAALRDFDPTYDRSGVNRSAVVPVMGIAPMRTFQGVYS